MNTLVIGALIVVALVAAIAVVCFLISYLFADILYGID